MLDQPYKYASSPSWDSSQMIKMEDIVVVFDFDKTIIDVDSDNWVLDELGFTELFNHLLLTIPWNSTMDMMMREVHDKGVTIDEIVAVLQRVPIHPRIVPTIKSLHSTGCCLRIVSDANRFFIETILDHLGLKTYFSSIDTNPGYVDEQGRLRIQPHQPDFRNSPHPCTNPNCAPNMCKGNVVERLIWEQKDKKFIYLGDGKGDYCPCLKLRDDDIVMPRKSFPICSLISANPDLIKARVLHWADGAHLETVLLDLIHTLSESETPKVVTHSYTTAVDCKLETVPTATSHEFEAMPKPLRVPF